jgi:hypothetical protein
MAWIRIGRFDDFKGAETLLIEADSTGMDTLIGVIHRLRRSGTPMRLDQQSGAQVHGDLAIVVEVVPRDEGISASGPNQLHWRRTSEGWADIVGKLRALREAEDPGHHYLDGPADSLQVMAAIGEYGEAWWDRNAD